MKAWILFADRKVRAEETPEANPAPVVVCLPRNAREGCQVILEGETDECGKPIAVTAQGENVTVSVFTETYQRVEITGREPEDCPDGLIPGGTVTLTAGRKQGFYILVSTARDNSAGDTEITVTVSTPEEEILRLTVPVHVWNFAYPDAMTCETAMGIGYGLDRYPAEERERLYRIEYDTMLASHICPYDLPYDLLDPRADAYLNDPRVTRFRIPYSADDAKIIAYREKLSKNQAWLQKGYFYCVDEPCTRELLQKLKEAGERLMRLWPGYHMVSPFFMNPQTDEKTDAVSFMSTYTDIFCPKTFCYTPRTPENDAVPGVCYFYTEEQTATEAPFEARMREARKNGATVWWYVCWEPGEPYANLFVDMPGLSHRALFWQQKAAGVNGFLYWCADYWKKTPDPWRDMRTVPSLSRDVYGDGSLLYPGDAVGLPDTFCGSLRLEAVRAGVEDYELLTMAEKALGEEETARILSDITADIIRYNRDSARFHAVRQALGNAVEAAWKE